MSEVEFQEVGAIDAVGAMSGETLIENGSSSQINLSGSTVEHIYIVFSDDVTIQEGITAIEEQVLSGESLDVSREDESGHAVVAIVTKDQRIEIEQLNVVKRVKVNEAAEVKESGDSSSNASKSTSIQQEDESDVKVSAETTESSTENSAVQNSSAYSTSEVSAEYIQEENTSTSASTMAYGDGTDNGNSNSTTPIFAIGIVVIIIAILIVLLARKK